MIYIKFVVILTLFLMGYGFATNFLPQKIKKQTISIWFYPWLGTVLISFFSTILYYGKISMEVGIYFIALLAIFLFLYALINKHWKHFFLKENLFILLIIFIGSIFFSISFDLSSLDQKADFLIKSSITSTKVLGRSFYEDSNLIGSSSIITFFSVLLKQKVLKTSNTIQPIYFLLLYPLIFFLLKEHILSKKYFLVGVLSIVLLILIYLLFNLFNFAFFHLLFFGVAFVFLTLIHQYLILTTKLKDGIISLSLFEVLLAITLSSTASIYPLGFKIIFVLIFFIGLLNLLQKRQRIFFLLSKIMVLSVAINPIILGVVLHIK